MSIGSILHIILGLQDVDNKKYVKRNQNNVTMIVRRNKREVI